MGLMRSACLLALGMGLAGGVAGATPSTNISNPSTDIQAPGVVHLGIDNYFSVSRNVNRPYAFPTDVGLTYGLGHGLEVGIDAFEPTPNPLVFNAKWGLPESKGMPALALGVQGWGTSAVTRSNIAYGLLAKSFAPVGRFTAGGYTGRKGFLGSEEKGFILAWDRSFGSKWWGSIDWASGRNPYGALAVGGSYKFTPKIGLIVGYVFFNDSRFNRNDTVTTQLDIDF